QPEFPVGARHLNHRGGHPASQGHRFAAAWHAGAADGALPNAARRALPQRRGHRRGGRRSRRGGGRVGSRPGRQSLARPAEDRWSVTMSEQVDDKVAGPPANLIVGVVKAMRPRQWVKNILVAAAPLAALGTDVHHDWTKVLVKVAIAFVVFCLAASSIYLVNDVRDVEADRQHPTKQFRPIAAGIVPVWLAYPLAPILGAAALAISSLASLNLVLVIAIYIAMQMAYCFGLKHQAVLDICIVSS